MTNNAAAALMFPVAWTLALSSGVDPMPFVMAIAFGASASFLTPFGYTTNLMVQNLGSYQRADYFRYGLPITLVYSTVVLLLLPKVFPLSAGRGGGEIAPPINRYLMPNFRAPGASPLLPTPSNFRPLISASCCHARPRAFLTTM